VAVGQATAPPTITRSLCLSEQQFPTPLLKAIAHKF
jgi:hypothetical protein